MAKENADTSFASIDIDLFVEFCALKSNFHKLSENQTIKIFEENLTKMVGTGLLLLSQSSDVFIYLVKIHWARIEPFKAVLITFSETVRRIITSILSSKILIPISTFHLYFC